MLVEDLHRYWSSETGSLRTLATSALRTALEPKSDASPPGLNVVHRNARFWASSPISTTVTG